VATTTTTVASITTLVEMGWLLTGPLGKRKLSYVKRFKLTGDFVPLSANP
jgi:hypothetical protein